MALPRINWTRILKALYMQAQLKRQRALDAANNPPPSP